LDAEDIVDIPKPDERSIMTYVAALYHVFSSSRKAEDAANKLSSVLDMLQESEKMKKDYEMKADEVPNFFQLFSLYLRGG
jgi:VanZ family protein